MLPCSSKSGSSEFTVGVARTVCLRRVLWAGRRRSVGGLTGTSYTLSPSPYSSFNSAVMRRSCAITALRTSSDACLSDGCRVMSMGGGLDGDAPLLGVTGMCLSEAKLRALTPADRGRGSGGDVARFLPGSLAEACFRDVRAARSRGGIRVEAGLLCRGAMPPGASNSISVPTPTSLPPSSASTDIGGRGSNSDVTLSVSPSEGLS
mmetsp:Transcript_4417/g.13484  ORF Transcript_4417/g.13484 Transcript_4417/m.13484 type:complete len:206 (-) Transcript_4417:276-893(-)